VPRRDCGRDRRGALVAEAVAAQTRNAAVVDPAPLAHDAALLVAGRRCTSGRSTRGPITAAVHPAVSQRRQRPSRPGAAPSRAPIGQAQQTHNGAVMAPPDEPPADEATGTAACASDQRSRALRRCSFRWRRCSRRSSRFCRRSSAAMVRSSLVFTRRMVNLTSTVTSALDGLPPALPQCALSFAMNESAPRGPASGAVGQAEASTPTRAARPRKPGVADRRSPCRSTRTTTRTTAW
jgi:hypothetical protein